MRQTIKTVLLTLLFVALAFLAWRGVAAIKQGDVPGKAAAGYLDALIKLGKLPTGDQVAAAIAQAQAPAKAPETKAPEAPKGK